MRSPRVGDNRFRLGVTWASLLPAPLEKRGGQKYIIGYLSFNSWKLHRRKRSEDDRGSVTHTHEVRAQGMLKHHSPKMFTFQTADFSTHHQGRIYKFGAPRPTDQKAPPPFPEDSDYTDVEIQ
ncbi:hypothetical protein J6590_024456 [Homalodisca vitripennis]|nr:hypothetical protein J6590_024456 [Homalodisca vitripennis]